MNEEKFLELLSNYPSPDIERSLLFVHPELAEEWHYEKNFPLTPDKITYGSSLEVWWKCKKGHEWKKSPLDRHGSPKCPVCLKEKTRLDLIRPDLALRWHPTKNGTLRPEDVQTGSNKKVWWKCSETHECSGIISHRAIGHNCRTCPLTVRGKRKTKVHTDGKPL